MFDANTRFEDGPTEGALAGVRVLDLSENLAGPYCTQILGDLGATVVKVERPGGDPARAWGPPFVGDDAALFVGANRHKRRLEVNLHTPEGLSRVRELASHADVFVQSFRPGAIERLGLGEAEVRARNPRIVYASISAYGDAGPLRDAPGYDPLLQAFAGLMSVTGEPAGDPARVGTSVIDMGAGMWLAIGVLTALHERERTGRGRRVDVSLLGAALSWMGYHLVGTQATGEAPGRQGTAFASIAPYEAFETADGRLMIAAANDGLFARLCEVLGRRDLVEEPRFGTNAGRVAERAALRAEIAGETSGWTTSALSAALQEAGVPSAPIHDVAEALAHPQVRASGLLSALPGRSVEVVPLPIAFDGVFPAVGQDVPRRPSDGGSEG